MKQQNKIGLMVNFLTKKSTEQRVFDYDVAQVRASDGKAIGWERFHVIKPERIQRLEADAGDNQEITDEESAQLMTTGFILTLLKTVLRLLLTIRIMKRFMLHCMIIWGVKLKNTNR